MGYFKTRYEGSTCHIYDQEDDEYLGLLQLDRNVLKPLSKIDTITGRQVRAKINSSYFVMSGSQKGQVLGRAQGERYNDTPDIDQIYDAALTADNRCIVGDLNSWDYTGAIVGFSPAVVLIKNSQDVQLISTGIVTSSKFTNTDPQTLFGFRNNGKAYFIVIDGRTTNNAGLNGTQCRHLAKSIYSDTTQLVMLDSGGSSEMIVNGAIKNTPSDGAERSLPNALAFIKKDSGSEGDDSMEYKTIHVAKIGLRLRKALAFSGRNPNGEIIGFIDAGKSMTFKSLIPMEGILPNGTGYQYFEVIGDWSYNGKQYTNQKAYIQYDSACYWLGK